MYWLLGPNNQHVCLKEENFHLSHDLGIFSQCGWLTSRKKHHCKRTRWRKVTLVNSWHAGHKEGELEQEKPRTSYYPQVHTLEPCFSRKANLLMSIHCCWVLSQPNHLPSNLLIQSNSWPRWASINTIVKFFDICDSYFYMGNLFSLIVSIIRGLSHNYFKEFLFTLAFFLKFGWFML